MPSGLHYGLCDSTSTYSWDLSYGLYELTKTLTGKLNVTLVRTEEIFQYGDDEITQFFSPVFCGVDDNHFFIQNINIQLKADEIYYWKPKEQDFIADKHIINYNSPCEDSDEPRVVNSWKCSASFSGVGDAVPVTPELLIALNSYSEVRFGVGFGDWEHHGRNHSQSLQAWRGSTSRFKQQINDMPMIEQDLSGIQISIQGIQNTTNFLVKVTKLKLFPDQDPLEMDFDTIKEDLLVAAEINQP